MCCPPLKPILNDFLNCSNVFGESILFHPISLKIEASGKPAALNEQTGLHGLEWFLANQILNWRIAVRLKGI
jgi:hypothetical protein